MLWSYSNVPHIISVIEVKSIQDIRDYFDDESIQDELT
jgi:hypothetical protein